MGLKCLLESVTLLVIYKIPFEIQRLFLNFLKQAQNRHFFLVALFKVSQIRVAWQSLLTPRTIGIFTNFEKLFSVLNMLSKNLDMLLGQLIENFKTFF